jgi:signal transduction histidine kinase
MREYARNILDVPLTDPDDRRRGRMLNILLLGFAFLGLLAAVLSFLFIILGPSSQRQAFLLILASVGVFFLGMILIFQLNRRGKGVLSSITFLVILTFAISLGDKPQEIFGGRSLYFFLLPIILASMLLRPYASLVAAAGITLLFLGGAIVLQVKTNFFVGPLAFFAVAFLSWLSSNSLESALKELRLINKELDARVELRTQELAEANQRLYKANEQLKSLDVLKSKFVSDVTHELRTPISNLRIYMEMLRAGKVEKQAQYLDVLQEETMRLSRLVEDVLDLSRMERGTKKAEFTWLEINQLVEPVVMANKVRADTKNLELIFDQGKDLRPIWADGNQIKQVVNNLLGNALNYTRQGKILVQTGFDTARKEVWLKVKDTGVGIIPEDLPHLFERFYRGRHASQSNIRGTGLGLAITKEIVDEHKGSIEVDSMLDVGSTFTIYLPIKREFTEETM